MNGHVNYAIPYQEMYVSAHYWETVGNGSYPYDTVASFSCNEGYYLSGNEEITCQTSGNWNMDTPVCNLGKEMSRTF